MQTKYILAAIFVCSTALLADEALLEGGASPDKSTGVYLMGEENGSIPDWPRMEVRKERGQKVLGSISCDSYIWHYQAALEDAKVAWSPDSCFFACLCRDTKTTRTAIAYSVANDKLTPITLPDCAQAIVSHIKNADKGRFFLAKSITWEAHDLRIRISGNVSDHASNPEDFPEDWYDCTVVVHVSSPQKAKLKDVIVHKRPKQP